MAFGLCLIVVAVDFEAGHGVEPLLFETFVGSGRCGISLAAASWIHVGQSSCCNGRSGAPDVNLDAPAGYGAGMTAMRWQRAHPVYRRTLTG